ncbi:hypothetical protein J4Q44_G00341360 [Coregonus suidteri]|uniref:Uncharacterized protein n=1 Tax=Coregonus suidteri TaxID=861788 RepID=A0AAN8KZK3_9TELE
MNFEVEQSQRKEKLEFSWNLCLSEDGGGGEKKGHPERLTHRTGQEPVPDTDTSERKRCYWPASRTRQLVG